jgi:hypothetical protein
MIVTTTFFVPGWFHVAVAVVPPLTRPAPLHRYETPVAGVELTDVVAVSLAHVRLSPPTHCNEGGVIFCDTLAVQLSVQPVAVIVTTTFFVPGWFHVAVALFPPETNPAPVHT